MASNERPTDEVDLALFHKNRLRFPPEQLLPYAGRHIAWNAEGTCVLECGESFEGLHDKLMARGIDPSRVVFDYVDPPDLVRL
jgi:hypothetical protein